MKKAGCYHIYFGVESGSQRILDFYQKDSTAKQAIEAFDLCRKLKILANASVILGAPEEKREDMEETFQLIKKLRPYKWLVHIATPFPGNYLYEYAKDNHLFSHNYRYEDMVFSRNLYTGKFPMKMKYLDSKDVLEYQKKIDQHMKKSFMKRSLLMPSLWMELISSPGMRKRAMLNIKKHFNPFRKRYV